MPYCKEPKFIYYHIPKCAGCTINSYISRATNKKVIYPNLGYDEKNGKLISCAERLNKCIDNYESYFKFTFVRNPYSKIVSSWAYSKKLEYHNDSFEKFIKNLNFYKQFKHIWWHGIISQSSHLKDNNKNVELDFIGKTEYLEEDLSNLMNILSLPNVTILNNNVNKHESWQSYYNKELQEIVYNYFEEDFKRFGYEKNI